MNKSYVIHWKSRSNGRIGTGTRRFPLDEAEQLASELNTDFPDIEHLVVPIDTDSEPLVPLMSTPEMVTQVVE